MFYWISQTLYQPVFNFFHFFFLLQKRPTNQFFELLKILGVYRIKKKTKRTNKTETENITFSRLHPSIDHKLDGKLNWSKPGFMQTISVISIATTTIITKQHFYSWNQISKLDWNNVNLISGTAVEKRSHGKTCKKFFLFLNFPNKIQLFSYCSQLHPRENMLLKLSETMNIVHMMLEVFKEKYENKTKYIYIYINQNVYKNKHAQQFWLNDVELLWAMDNGHTSRSFHIHVLN